MTTTNRMANAILLLLVLPTCFYADAVDRLVGEWRAASLGITRIQIRRSDSQLRIHAFGSCHPQDCDWGEVDAQPYAAFAPKASLRDSLAAISALFDAGFSKTLVVIYPGGPDQVRLETFTSYKDPSRTPFHDTEIMKRVK